MNPEARQEARRLRAEEAMSIGQIAANLGVSKSSVSRWVHDVCLTEEQISQICTRNPIYNRQIAGSGGLKAKCRVIRQDWRDRGRERAREGDPLHMAGCMLYWAEGTKQRNVLSFTNSDPDMMAYFLRFLRCCYDVKDAEVRIHINCFDDCSKTEDTEDFWLHTLSLSRQSLGKTTLNVYSGSSQKKRCHTLIYGTCKINVCRTSIVQSIYGAIQEYAGVDVDKWGD